MNEAFSFALILFLIYLLQCFASTLPSSVVFFLDYRLRGRLLRHYWQIGPSGRRVFLLNPFLPHVGALHTDRVPFAVRFNSAGDLIGLESLSPPSDSVPPIFAVDGAHAIEAFAKKVIVDDQVFLCLRSESAAQQIAALLRDLQNTARANRMPLLERHFKEMFALKVIDERLEKYSQSTEYLQTACFSLLFFMLFLGPATASILGLRRVWPALLLYLVLSSASILWLFRRAYRQLYPWEKGWPLQHMLTIAVSPFAAIRANDLLVAELLSEFHPVAVAWRVLSELEFSQFGSAELRKVRFLHSDEFLAKSLRDFFVENGLDPEFLLRAPSRERPSSLAYCPVCLTQYVIASGVCQDCDGTPLAAFSADEVRGVGIETV
jgi:hypothetical protein